MSETQTIRFRDLVLTMSYDHDGYEMLVEVDTYNYETTVPVEISNAAGDEVLWLL